MTLIEELRAAAAKSPADAALLHRAAKALDVSYTALRMAESAYKDVALFRSVREAKIATDKALAACTGPTRYTAWFNVYPAPDGFDFAGPFDTEALASQAKKAGCVATTPLIWEC